MQVVQFNNSINMTSREIAELCGKEHAHVMRDIRAMFEQLESDEGGYIQKWRHPQNGQEYAVFALPKDLTLTLVSGYSVVLRKRIIDRWIELETTPSPQFNIPTTLSAALRLAAEQAETIEAQALQIEAAKPAVQFVETYVNSDSGSKGFRQVCKLLHANESEFREFLSQEKIMYKLGGEWMPYANHMEAGRFEVKAGANEASGHAFNQAKFTAKGVQWVAGEWAKHQVAMSIGGFDA